MLLNWSNCFAKVKMSSYSHVFQCPLVLEQKRIPAHVQTNACRQTKHILKRQSRPILYTLNTQWHSVYWPELCFEFIEAGPFAGVVGPAFGHQAVQSWRTVVRHGQPLAILNAPNDIIVFHTLKRFHPVHQDLPHTHTWKHNTEEDSPLQRWQILQM